MCSNLSWIIHKYTSHFFNLPPILQHIATPHSHNVPHISTTYTPNFCNWYIPHISTTHTPHVCNWHAPPISANTYPHFCNTYPPFLQLQLIQALDMSVFDTTRIRAQPKFVSLHTLSNNHSKLHTMLSTHHSRCYADIICTILRINHAMRKYILIPAWLSSIWRVLPGRQSLDGPIIC